MDDTLFSRRDAFRRYAEGFYEAHAALHETPRSEAIALLTRWDGRGDNDKEVYFENVRAHWPGIGKPTSQLIEEFWVGLAAGVSPDQRALDFLAELNRVRLPWGIITNGPEYQFDKLRNGGLEGVTPFAIVSGIFGHSKPDPRIFEEGLQRLGAGATGTVFVGDNPRTDIRGAQSVGMPTAWVRAGRTWSWGAPEPDYQIDHVTELRPLLQG